MDLSGIIGELQDQRNIRDQCRSNSVTFINVRIAVEYLYKQQSGLEMVPHLTDLFSQYHSFAFVSHCLCLCDYPLQLYSVALRPLQSPALVHQSLSSIVKLFIDYLFTIAPHPFPLSSQARIQPRLIFYFISQSLYHRYHSITAIDL